MSVKKSRSEVEDQDVCEASGNAESGSKSTSNRTSIDTDMYTSRPGFGRGGCGPIEVQCHATRSWIDTVLPKNDELTEVLCRTDWFSLYHQLQDNFRRTIPCMDFLGEQS